MNVNYLTLLIRIIEKGIARNKQKYNVMLTWWRQHGKNLAVDIFLSTNLVQNSVVMRKDFLDVMES